MRKLCAVLLCLALVAGGAAFASEVTLENCMENSAFLGNSLLVAVDTGGFLKECDLYYKIGLNVKSALTKSVEGSGKRAAVEALTNKPYERVFLEFGINELEWPNPYAIIERYATLLDAVQERCPNARIYMVSIIPVAKFYAESVEITMELVNDINSQLSDLCAEKGVYFIDVTDALVNEKGYLHKDYSSDGCHLKSSRTDILVNEIRAQVVKNENP